MADTPNKNFITKPAKETAIYKQCVRVYEALEEQAEDATINDEKVRQWRGPLVEFIVSLDVPMGSYSKVRMTLTDLGCITVATEGRTLDGSTVFLHFSPATVSWNTKPERKRRDLTRGGENAMLGQQLKGIISALGGLNVKDALVNMEKRLISLEQEMMLLKKERTVGKKEKPESSTRSTSSTDSTE